MAMADGELVLVPLGGLGEIGMNAMLYGFGPKGHRKWILIDLGIAFAGPELAGIDVLMPDLTFIEKMKKDLLGLVITHAHEDHIGAVADLWPRLGCPVYATRFATGLLETKRLNEPGAPKVPLHVVEAGKAFQLGPFSIEYVPMAHSIPESCGLAIRTPAGLVMHTGDWKIDETPLVGWATNEKRLREIGEEGVLALVCDSTNILREGQSPSETDVAQGLAKLVAEAPGRVVVTTFASNVARLRAVADAAQAAGRTVVVVGRAMERVVQVARECGYLDGVPTFLSAEAFGYLAREQTVILATGSQGESRAALARIAANEHPEVTLSPGDRVIFSSRTIPGNEKGVGQIINGLTAQGVEVVTDRDGLVHVSGHPRRAEVAKMYDWIRPQIAIPAHGEEVHLAEHARFAREHGAKKVVTARNGDMVLLGPGDAGVIDQVQHGRMCKDGNVLVSMNDDAIRARVALAFAGIVSVALAINVKGDLVGDPDVMLTGLPGKTRDGRAMDEVVDEAIFGTIDHLPRAKRRDADATAQSVERAIRNTLRQVWGKKPVVHVLVVEV
ncbi:MAG: ribonuclease J [Beijerinckiaceae bacterium]|nr:ribonuclease J [Beijerinckiaceae bacterium]